MTNATAYTDRSPAVLTDGSPTEQAALEYAGRFNWLVVPSVGKRPHPKLAPHGLKSASADPDVIRVWYRAEPNANVAIVCRPSGLLAIDVDERHGGHDQLDDLERDLGRLPDTPRSLTGGGGCHILTQNPRIRTVNKIATGVDVRDRAFVIAPPSMHRSGQRYEWEIPPEEMPVAQLPLQWIDRLAKRAGEHSHRRLGPIGRGRRNEVLTKIAGAHRRAGSSSEAIEAALLVINRERCKPPLADNEIRKIARSIGKRTIAPLWALDPLAFTNSRANLTAVERLVLIALCHRANDQGQIIGGEWIQKETGLSKSSVIRATQRLEAQGRIVVARRKNRSNLYALIEVDDDAHACLQARPLGGGSGSSGVSLTPTELAA